MIKTLLASLVIATSMGTALAAAEKDNTPPSGFSSLFNGKDLTGWKADDKTKEHWKVANGVLAYSGKYRSLVTEKDFKNFIMQVDFKIQKGADSGIFLRGRPQVQIWDNPEGSGGLWNDRVKALKKADNPIGEWNHFEIHLEKGNRVTVFLNGEKVVDGFEKKNLPATGPLVLQHHGNPLWFKNIYIKELPE
jgi:hypothetical protein